MSKKKYRKFYFLFLILSWICLFTPILIVIIINWDRYFIQKSGWSVGMGGVLAVLLVVLLLKYGSKKFNRIFWSTAFLIVVICLNSIIQDALILSFTFWLGTLLFTILEIPTNYFKKRYDIYNEAITREEAKEEYRQQKEVDTDIEGR